MSTTARDEIIAEEQKAVDHAYNCYEKRLAELSGGSIASASASGKDSVANRQAADDKAAEYAGLGDASLVISRVDTRDGPDEEPDTWYVGRRAVSDVETRDSVVVLWTTPQAQKWSKALPDAPGDMLLRRQLRCTQRVVNEYVDEISVAVPSPQPVEDEAAPEATTTAPSRVLPQPEPMQPPALTPSGPARGHRKKPQAVDDLLLRELQRSRRGSMRDIVETIRRDQMNLVTESPPTSSSCRAAREQASQRSACTG